MSTIIESLKNVAIPGLSSKLRLSPLANAGTMQFIDMTNLNSFDGVVGVNNKTLKDLSGNNKNINLTIPNNKISFSSGGGGLVFASNNASDYGVVDMPPIQGKSILMQAFFRMPTVAITAASCIIGSSENQVSPTIGQFLLGRHASGSSSVANRVWDSTGTLIPDANLTQVFFSSAATAGLCQIAIVITINETGTQYKAYWRNDAFNATLGLVNSGTFFSAGKIGLPSPSQGVGLGAFNSSGFSPNFRGKFYSWYLEDLDLSGVDPVATLQAHWNYYKTNISS